MNSLYNTKVKAIKIQSKKKKIIHFKILFYKNSMSICLKIKKPKTPIKFWFKNTKEKKSIQKISINYNQ